MGTTSATDIADAAAEGTLVSIGYEGKAAGDLVAQLLNRGVRVLVDVRLTPLSRKPGLSKTKLSAALSAVESSTCITAPWATRRTTAPRSALVNPSPCPVPRGSQKHAPLIRMTSYF